MTGKDAKSYFIEVPIIQQLQALISRKGFYETFQHRFTRPKTDTIRGIYDGSVYRHLSQDGNILGSPDNISFVMNSNGTPVFKSSKVSIWPVFLIINELPSNLRIAKENMIFAGLWFGDIKPLMTSFLKPIFSHLNELESGVEVESPERGNINSEQL